LLNSAAELFPLLPFPSFSVYLYPCFAVPDCVVTGLKKKARGIREGSRIVFPSPFPLFSLFLLCSPPQLRSVLRYWSRNPRPASLVSLIVKHACIKKLLSSPFPFFPPLFNSGCLTTIICELSALRNKMSKGKNEIGDVKGRFFPPSPLSSLHLFFFSPLIIPIVGRMVQDHRKCIEIEKEGRMR